MWATCRDGAAIIRRQSLSYHHHKRITVKNYCRRLSSTSMSRLSDDCSSNDDVAKHQEQGSILFLSPSNWPEPNATAAGTRTMSLLNHFSTSSNSPFTSVHFGCGATLHDSHILNPTGNSNIYWHQIKPNRTEDMKNLIHTIETKHNNPIRAVVFDRFYAEEAYSFRIKELCPNALLILDMQDVHSLRIGRQCIVEEEEEDTSSMTRQLINRVMEFDPSTNYHNYGESKQRKKAYDTFLREMASIHRSDLVLVCSSEELKMLESWGIPKWKLVHASFFCMDNEEKDTTDDTTKMQQYAYEDRVDFVTLGGFKHQPNVDSVRLLHREIWPRIRAQLPNARLHVYGAYTTPQIQALYDEKTGFLVHGYVDDLEKVLLQSRVLLAPLRFGAGCKGKIIDAWTYGCPVVTTPVGAEGMRNEFLSPNLSDSWGGSVVSDTNEFIEAAVKVYTQKHQWQRCRDEGSRLLKRLFNGRVNLPLVENGVRNGMKDLKKNRRLDIVGSILWRDTLRSTEYFSKWIELKESLSVAEKNDDN